MLVFTFHFIPVYLNPEAVLHLPVVFLSCSFVVDGGCGLVISRRRVIWRLATLGCAIQKAEHKTLLLWDETCMYNCT